MTRTRRDVFDVGEPARPRFRTTRRGYDTREVDAFVSRMARKTLALDAEVRRHKAQMDLLVRKAASADEAAYERVARQVCEVMRTAEREAGRIRAEAEREAEAILTRAREEASLVELVQRGENGGRRKATVAARALQQTDDLTIDVEMLWGRSEPWS